MAILPLSGFASVGYGAIIESNSVINEYVTFSYNNTQPALLGVTNEKFDEFLAEVGEELSEVVKNNLKSQIAKNTSLSVESKANLSKGFSVSADVIESQFILTITYANSTYWNYFCGDYASKTEKEGGLFTFNNVTTMKTKSTKLEVNGAILPLPRAVYNGVVNSAVDAFGSEAQTVFNAPEYRYSYITTKHRIHSNATEQKFFGGYYYHIWDIQDIETTTIKLHTTHLNSIVWYILALGLTLIFMAIILIVGHIRKKRENALLEKAYIIAREAEKILEKNINQNDNAENNKNKNDNVENNSGENQNDLNK